METAAGNQQRINGDDHTQKSSYILQFCFFMAADWHFHHVILTHNSSRWKRAQFCRVFLFCFFQISEDAVKLCDSFGWKPNYRASTAKAAPFLTMNLDPAKLKEPNWQISVVFENVRSCKYNFMQENTALSVINSTVRSGTGAVTPRFGWFGEQCLLQQRSKAEDELNLTYPTRNLL